MCLIISKPERVSISVELLEDAYQLNPDGWGIMLADRGRVYTQKGFDLPTLIVLNEALAEYELFVHLRMKTHGKVNLENCHPFQVTERIWMMHNGIIDIDRPCTDWSDTKAFVAAIAPQLEKNPDLLFDPMWQLLVSRFVENSRLVFLCDDGRKVIINERDGINWDGLWLSNLYAWSLWKPVVTPKIAFSNYLKDSRSCSQFRWDEGNPKINLNYLRSLDISELEELIWQDPDSLIEAILYS